MTQKEVEDLRDAIAISVMEIYLSKGYDAKVVPELAYRLADEMLLQRAK